MMQQTEIQKTRTTMSSYEDVQTPETVGIAPEDITRVLLQDGWHKVSECQFVNYGIGERHSPISLQKTYAALRFTENGQEYIVPLSKLFGVNASKSSSNSGSSTSRSR